MMEVLMEPGFYWGRVRPWCEASQSELVGPDGWEPVAVHERTPATENRHAVLMALLLGDGRGFELDDVEIGERLVRSGTATDADAGA